MSRRQPLRLLAVALAAAALCPATLALAQDLPKVLTDLSFVEGEAEQLGRTPLGKTQLRSSTHVEERLTDGELFFRLQDYVRASVIFTDIVDNHPQHRAYPDALFLLSESLFHAGDYLGARTRFRQVLQRSDEGIFRPHLQRSLGRLIEIAIRIRDFDGVESYFARLSRLPPAEVEDATSYFRAKYLYSLAVPEGVAGKGGNPDEQTATESFQVDAEKLEQSRLAFESVSDRSPYYPQARYFIGVIHTLRGQYGPAIDAFQRVCKVKPTTEEQRRVVELAELGMGRLHYEMGSLDQAIASYQLVERTSPVFDAALYEIAWVYIRQGDSSRAERALEVLSIAVPDSRYIPDAKILRGNLLLRNGRFKDAVGVFHDVGKQFEPVKEELESIAANREDPAGHFRALVRDNMESFDINAFLPPLALRWGAVEGEMDRAMSTLSDLSQARQLVMETSDIVDRLQRAIAGHNPVNIFPDLRAHRERSVGLRNRLASVRLRLMKFEEKSSGNAGSSELTAVRTRRRELERRLAGAPSDPKDFRKRQRRADKDFQLLRNELSRMEVQLMGMEAKITATKRFAADTMRGDGVEALRTELETQKTAISDYRGRIKKLRNDLEAGRLQVGVGDNTYQHDEQLRKEHKELIEEERRLLVSLGVRPDGRLDAAYRRVDSTEAMLDAHDDEVNQVVTTRVADMQAVLQEEGAKLEGYRSRMAALEGETEVVVGGIAYANYKRIRGRFYNLVLRADVGLIDVGWAEREEHRMRVEMLTRERARSLQALDDEYREIMEGGER